MGSFTRPKVSLILIWSFQDPIHPQLILEAPDDINCFKFNPIESSIIVGGCINGQLVLWDISKYSDFLKSTRGSDDTKEKKFQTPSLKYDIVSSIESSHRGMVQDLHWLPQNFELSPSGEPLENAEAGHKQLVTASLDGTIAFWDLRFKKDIKALDLTWRPFIRVGLSALDNSFDYSITRISINPLITFNEEKVKPSTPSQGNQDKQPEAEEVKKEKKKQQNKSWTSKFYCATEEGDVIYSDWLQSENAKPSEEKVSRVENVLSYHYGPVNDLQRSPFFPDILLSAGGWNFHIWKEKTNVSFNR